MRRFPLPPPSMWPCDRPIVNVLNGFYPSADLRRMSLPGLERLVSKLVQRTSKSASKPLWWPNGLVFTHPLDLGLSSEREIKLAFKQLIVSCCQFFEERRRRRTTPRTQLFSYLQLQPRKAKFEPPAAPSVVAPKLAACPHIPFSSDLGRIMAAKEQHSMPEELKMRRLERCEWWVNKDTRTSEVAFEVASWREPEHSHMYRMPKRQQYQKRRSMYNREFLRSFCTPLRVLVPKLDLDKVKSVKRKELFVLIKDTERMCCDFRRGVKIVRTSPRLRNI